MIDYMSYRQAKDLVGFDKLIRNKKGKRKRVSEVSLSKFFTSTPMRR
jgi:hypothetical protein